MCTHIKRDLNFRTISTLTMQSPRTHTGPQPPETNKSNPKERKKDSPIFPLSSKIGIVCVFSIYRRLKSKTFFYLQFCEKCIDLFGSLPISNRLARRGGGNLLIAPPIGRAHFPTVYKVENSKLEVPLMIRKLCIPARYPQSIDQQENNSDRELCLQSSNCKLAIPACRHTV